MSQIIRVSAARKINESSRYVRFFHTKSYVEQKSRVVPYSLALHHERVLELMTHCGYRNRRPDKFNAHRRQWDQLERPIPRAYLKAVGVDIDTLLFTAELDAEEYDEVLRLPFSPRYATVRVVPAVYSRLELPEGIDELEAISYVRDFAWRRGKRCCIGYRDIKTVWIEGNGDIAYSFYRPHVTVTRSYVMPSNEPAAFGHLPLD